MKREYFAWTELGRGQIENGHLVLYRRPHPRPGGDVGTPLGDIPNYLVLLELLSEKGVSS